jgi:alpha-L-fucosidase 2
MNLRKIFILLVFSSQACAQPIDSTEWKNYMKFTRLYWDSLGTDYYDGIIAGNGRLGVNMYRENPRAIRFDIGRSDVTDQRPHYPDSIFTQQLVSRPRLPIGKMVIRSESEITGADIHLDIYNAEARGRIMTRNGGINIFFFVPSGEDVVHIELSESGNEKIICEWTGEKSMTPRISFGRVTEKEYQYKRNPDFQLKDSAGHGICYQPLLFNGEYATVWTHRLEKEKHIIDVAVGYSETEKGKAIPEGFLSIKSFQSKPFERVYEQHKKWWNAYYQKSFISIPDKRLETYYWIQLYKLASATRQDKPMIDLMGPWFTGNTPWPAIWWNLNTQLTYSPMFTSNHLELTKPLFDQLNNNLQHLIQNVPAPWRNDAAAIGRMSGFDLHAPLNQNDLRKGQFEPGNLVWVMLYYYRYYQYTGDENELRNKIYPLLKRAVNYLVHLLQKDAQGIYHLPKSHSPEFADAEDAHYTLAGLIWGLQTMINLNEKFKFRDAEPQKWREVLQHLVPLHANEKGFMIGRNVELTSSHRHYSHLMAIYPYRLLNMDDPAHRKITQQSIDHWHSMPSALAGYSYTGASGMYSLLGEGDKSIKFLNAYLDRHAEPGGLYREAGPCFETPMAFATSLLEMLIQSDEKSIRIFPAIPAEWQELSFHQLAAEGAFLLDAVKYKGSLQQVKVKSLKGNPCLLELWSENEFDLLSDKRGIVIPKSRRTQNKLTISFETQAGETITLKRKNMSTARDLLVHFKDEKSYWGLNRNFQKKSSKNSAMNW